MSAPAVPSGTPAPVDTSASVTGPVSGDAVVTTDSAPLRDTSSAPGASSMSPEKQLGPSAAVYAWRTANPPPSSADAVDDWLLACQATFVSLAFIVFTSRAF